MKGKIIFFLVVVLSFYACDKKEDFEQVNSSTVDVAGEWWVQYSDGEGYESGFYKLLTFNTAADDGQEMWIHDADHWWYYKVKCPVNVADKTFTGTNMISAELYQGEPYDISINITNGKIIEGVSLQPSGVMADSIVFNIEFEDDAGTIYQASGFRKTGFLEDEH